MKKMVFSTVFLAVGIFVSASAPAHAEGNNPAQRCHLSASGDEILVDYSGTLITTQGTSSYSVNASVPAGTYAVYLEGFDGYEGRSDQSQKNETYKVSFYAGGNKVATSNKSGDIEDGVEDAYWKGKVNSELKISEDVSKLRVQHASGDTSSPHSLSPTCMLLKPEKEEPQEPQGPVCGNGKLESSEQCDDGNDTPGDGCSASCSLERQIIDPVCGNGSVEPGEQCDDGNADEISCTRQCRVPAPAPTAPAPTAPVHTPDPEDDDHRDCDGEVGNTVFNDLNANGFHDENEPGLTDVKLKLQYGDKVKTERTNFRGRYKFEDRCEDTYRVIVATETLPSTTCYPTYDKDGKLDNIHKLELDDDDDEYTKADFGYHCPLRSSGSTTKKTSPATGAGPLAGGAAAVFASGAAFVANRRMQGESGTIISLK